jgi:cellulose synthase (UDP-forming)
MSLPSDVPLKAEPSAQLTYVQPYPRAHGSSLWLIRTLIVLNLALGLNYLAWRFAETINWSVWWIALPLIAAETYSLIDAFLFGVSMWKWRGGRAAPPPPPDDATVDIFITCYNEPAELVRTTARAARNVRYPHRTYVLDDGNSLEMAAMARDEGVGYVTRTAEWRNRPRHAKAGNVINALQLTDGQFIVILDADQVPAPEFLDRTLGYFADPRVAFVQTPQFFYNVPPGDPFGSQAPLFYGPIQEGKDSWNAAFFCGSNAVLRREALMFTGVTFYVRETEARVRATLRAAHRLLRRSARSLRDPATARAVRELDVAVSDARRQLDAGAPIQAITWEFQRRADAASHRVVSADLDRIRTDLATVVPEPLPQDEAAVQALAGRASTPLAAMAEVKTLLLGMDVDRAEEVHAVMPIATISVTEDLATAMRMHSLGWTSVYHGENLVIGLAPEDLATAMTQRLRWAQGTLQVLFRENPLFMRGLSVAQRLMYFGTMWSYLSGLVAPIYLLAPVLFLFLDWLPVRADALDFCLHLIPFLVVNEVLFAVIGRGRPTWRGRQYSLALFPVWLTAITTATSQVFLGRDLAFAVTPKTRQGRAPWHIVRWQLVAMGLLAMAAAYGVGRLALGDPNRLPIAINLMWVTYDLALLSVVVRALRHTPSETAATPDSMLALAPGGTDDRNGVPVAAL